VPGMEQVEAAVGDNEFFSAGSQCGAPCGQVFPCHDFLRKFTRRIVAQAVVVAQVSRLADVPAILRSPFSWPGSGFVTSVAAEVQNDQKIQLSATRKRGHSPENKMDLPPPTEKQARLIWLALTGLALAVIVALVVGAVWGLGRVLNVLSPCSGPSRSPACWRTCSIPSWIFSSAGACRERAESSSCSWGVLDSGRPAGKRRAASRRRDAGTHE